MADVVYNPLLKRNIQYLGSGSDVDAKIAALQNAINDLQSRLNDLKNTKITKVTAAAQLSDLTNGEIFEWQTTTTQQFTQGYFYQKNGNNYTRVDLQPQYNLPIAAADTLGGVKVGSGLDIDESGLLSVAAGDSLKVPRCFTQAQINDLSANDIFQWQGDTTSDFVNGYFYKKVVEHNIGDLYLHVATNHNISIYNGGSYSLNIGDYYNDSGATPIFNTTINTAVFSNSSGANCNFIFISNDEQSMADVAVGDWVLFNNSERNIGTSTVFQWVNNGLFYIAQLTEITRDGFGDISSFKIGTSAFTWVSRYGRITNSANSIPVNINGVQTNVFYNDANNAALVFAPMANGKFAPVMIFETMAALENPIMEYVQTDTQPQPTNGSDMIVNFTPDTSAVRANIQSGETLATIAGKLSNIFKILNTFEFPINDYSYGICLIDVTDWYVNNTSTNYKYVLNGLICATRYFGVVDTCSIFNVCANCNYTRNYKLMYSKNNGYSVNVVNYNSRYYIAINRIAISAVQLTFLGVCSNLLTTPIQLTSNDVPVIYSGVEY